MEWHAVQLIRCIWWCDTWLKRIKRRREMSSVRQSTSFDCYFTRWRRSNQLHAISLCTICKWKKECDLEFLKIADKISDATRRCITFAMEWNAINVTMNDGHLTILHIHVFYALILGNLSAMHIVRGLECKFDLLPRYGLLRIPGGPLLFMRISTYRIMQNILCISSWNGKRNWDVE